MIFRLLLLLLLPVMAYFFVKSISQRYTLSSRQNTYLFFLVASLLVVGVMIAIGRLPFQFILAPLGVLPRRLAWELATSTAWLISLISLRDSRRVFPCTGHLSRSPSPYRLCPDMCGVLCGQ